MKILPLFTHPHIVNLIKFISSVDKKKDILKNVFNQ